MQGAIALVKRDRKNHSELAPEPDNVSEVQVLYHLNFSIFFALFRI